MQIGPTEEATVPFEDSCIVDLVALKFYEWRWHLVAWRLNVSAQSFIRRRSQVWLHPRTLCSGPAEIRSLLPNVVTSGH